MDENKNHVEKEDDQSYFDKFNNSERDEIFTKFMSQSPVDFSELEQYTDDEMSSILKQEVDDSAVIHIPCTSQTPSSVELAADLKTPRKKKSKSALEESAALNPRRSKRLMLKRASGIKSENMKRVEEYIMEEGFLRAQARARAAQLAMSKTEANDLINQNADLKENQICSQDAKNGNIKLGVQSQKLTVTNPTIQENYAYLLPNLQGQEHSVETLLEHAGASSNVARGDDALPRCTIDCNRSPDDSLEKNDLAKGSGKSTDLAPTN